MLLAFVLLPTRVDAAWAFVSGQTATSSGNDAALTFTSAIGNGNIVLIGVALGVTDETISVTNSAFAIDAVVGPIDASTNRRIYIFCGTGDGTDGTFTITTSGAAAAMAHGIEFSGGTCTLDGTSQSTELSNQTSHVLATDVSVTQTTSLLIGVIRSTSAADFDPGTDMTQFGTDAEATSAEYRILTGAGSFDVPFSSPVNETTLLVGAAFQASGGVEAPKCHRSLMGVGCNE